MKLQSKKLNPPFSIKTNGREDAKEVIHLLVEIGFKANEFWNREQLKEKFYDKHLDKGFVNVNSENVIELHTHSCDNDVISRKYLLKEIPKPEYDPKDVAFKNDVYSNSEFYGEKKILKGYKFKTQELLENFKLIYEGFAPWDDEFDLLPNNILKQRLENLGVIELWFQPVYDTSITLKSGVTLSEDDIAEVKEILNTENRNNNLI